MEGPQMVGPHMLSHSSCLPRIENAPHLIVTPAGLVVISLAEPVVGTLGQIPWISRHVGFAQRF